MTPSVRFGVLGPLVVWRGDELITPRSASHRALLGILLLAEGAALTAQRMAELVSAANQPKNPRLWAQVAVSRLRTWLAEAVGDAVTVEFSGNGYRLVTQPQDVDLARFRQLHAAAATAGSPAEKAALLNQGLGLWRGPALSDGPDGVRDSGIAAALDRLRLDAACALAEASIACSDPRPIVDLLDGLVREHPLDERLNAWWALVLAACGQQADALAAIDATKGRLADELGVDAGEHLREAQLRVLRQEVLPATAPAIPQPPAAAEPPWRGPRGQVSAVIGRDEQLRELIGLLAEARLVTILGPGGCGKTTVALHVAGQLADRHPDGVVVLVATPLRTADELLLALGSLMGVTAPTADQLRVTLTRAVKDRRMLLVLDNCEHMAADCAAFVRWLAGVAPGVVVLATSRQPLDVTEELAWQLGPLALPAEDGPADATVPAVALFLRRAKEALPSFVPEEADLHSVGRLCRRLDGLPLALELAAAAMRALTITQIADRLANDFRLLNVGRGSRESRHLTLRSTLEWSYELLDEAERTLLTRLSVFRGGCTVEAAEAVCSGAPLHRDDVLPTLVALVDKSLVQPYGTDGGRRFRLLETVAEFAADRLAEAGQTAAVEGRLLDHWLARGRALDPNPRFNQRADACRGWAADLGNVRAALAHGYAEGRANDAAELTVRLILLWWVNGAYAAEVAERLRYALDHMDQDASPEISCLIRYWLSVVLRGMTEDHAATRAAIQQMLPELGRYRPREYRLASIAAITFARFMADPAAVEGAGAMLEAMGDDDHDDEPSTALTAAGTVYAAWGRYAEAASAAERYAERAALRGTPISASQHVMRLETALGLGDADEARRQHDILRDRLPTIDDPAEREPARRVIGIFLLATDEPAAARDFLTDAVEDLRRYLPPQLRRDMHLLVLLGEAHRRTGARTSARQSLRQALTRALTGNRYEASLIAVLATALLADETDAAGRDLADTWDEVRRRLGLPVPPGFRAAAASQFGFDPAGGTPSADPGRWRPDELHRLVTRAHSWCVTP